MVDAVGREAEIMMNEAAYLAVWIVGLFGIVGIVSWCTTRLVVKDSFAYDELFVWGRKLPPEAGPDSKTRRH
ncbi:hypothetical protein NNL21_05835 [Paenibacillus mendelii]|nr:hypothetical protein [Paenibacillus mendelii]